ncbi:hypothetical protein GLW08_04385 [Pontibacillus yanchengensis]|uniref:Uncharacterized protein n=2 Tax=Pontibacillus yanchengensis TaxID=462910 RepID=A0ACC7VC63_9BACI|nr:hypothetical protein [Pontibacillus yanchengensis]MYL31994.1 hypothetical protein [Pontibacillus yanchengensis]MYL52571.1 hypothetical protein [Pontibacillus yanchengensis]
MRHDIEPNERAFSSKAVADELGIATTTVRKYGQILERNGYEFFKDGDRRIFVRSDIKALIAIRDTAKNRDDTAIEIVAQQKERLEETQEAMETKPATQGTYDHSLQDPNQLHEFIKFLSSELAATREMNVQLQNDMSHLKSTVSQLQQDHHVISSGVGNFSQKTNTKIEKLVEQQQNHYEQLLEQEKQKSELLQEEIKQMREEQQKEWRVQNDFNKQIQESFQRPKGFWESLFSIFRK